MKLIITIFTLALLGACAKKDETPIQVFQEYSKELNDAQTLTEFRFSKYLTDRAQLTVADKVKSYSPELLGFDFSLSVNGKPVELETKRIVTKSTQTSEDKMLAILLEMLREDATISEDFINTLSETNQTAEVVSTRNNFPETGSNYTRTVFFKKQNGWKIDKIKTVVESDGSKLSSLTYD